jgi:putative autotransporter adhesin-like protein
MRTSTTQRDTRHATVVTTHGSDRARPRNALALVLGTMLLAGCSLMLRATGAETTESRSVGAFTTIDVSDGIGVDLRIGPDRSLEVQAQADALPLIATDVEGDVLRIHATGDYLAQPVVVTIVTPLLEGVSLSGGSRADVEGLASAEFVARLSGSSNLGASGSVDVLDLGSSGASRSELDRLEAARVRIDLSGSSVAEVRASTEVSGSASGGSRVTIRGGAAVDVASTGGSVVTSE